MAYKVTVVGCSPFLQKAILIALTGPKYEVIFMPDEQELMNKIGVVSPDIILLRLALPAQISYDVSRFLKSQPQFKDIPLILLQGLFEPLASRAIIEGNFDNVVKLPFVSSKLSEMILNLVEKKKIPLTLPEEPEGADMLVADPQTDLESKIREIVSQEVLAMERELEKRLKAQILPEIKTWLKKELEKARGKK